MVAGEAEILLGSKISKKERKSRLYMMSRLGYLANNTPVERIRDIHKSLLSAVEKGEIKWGRTDQIDALINNVLVRVSHETKNDRSKTFKGNDKQWDNNKVYWCKDYNKTSCPHTDHHDGLLGGKIVRKWHICRVCFSAKGIKRFHKESDPNCPNKPRENFRDQNFRGEQQ